MAEEKMTAQDEQIELLSFDPIVAVLDVLRRWYLIAAVALIAAMGVYTVTELTYEPQYTTETTFVVSMQESSASVFQNLSATSNLATMFSEVLNSSLLRKTVNESLAPEQFNGRIEAAAIAETNLLTMRVTASDPRIAFLATQAIIDHHRAAPRAGRAVEPDARAGQRQEGRALQRDRHVRAARRCIRDARHRAQRAGGEAQARLPRARGDPARAQVPHAARIAAP